MFFSSLKLLNSGTLNFQLSTFLSSATLFLLDHKEPHAPLANLSLSSATLNHAHPRCLPIHLRPSQKTPILLHRHRHPRRHHPTSPRPQIRSLRPPL